MPHPILEQDERDIFVKAKEKTNPIGRKHVEHLE
jgi:hypothetical protein